jgi:hypothetical protein
MAFREIILDPYYQPGGKSPGAEKILRIPVNVDKDGNQLANVGDHLWYQCKSDKRIRCIIMKLELTKKGKTDITIKPFCDKDVLGKIGSDKMTVFDDDIVDVKWIDGRGWVFYMK